jgi:hypothetical protein
MDKEYNPRQLLEDNGYKTAYENNIATIISPHGERFCLGGDFGRFCFFYLAIYVANLYGLKGLTRMRRRGGSFFIEDHLVDYYTEKYGWQRF